MAAVDLQGVTKSYDGRTTVIHGIDLQVRHGEFVVFVGPSGCGKSTLLRMIAGLEQISGGEVRIGEQRVNDLPPKQRDIAMVFQNYALYPHMTVFENMAYGLKIAKVPVEEIRTRVDKAARILEIGPYLQRRPREVSGGQRQRVAMGRAIVRQPQVFLFDEPLSNLDAKLRAQTRIEIQKLHRELGITSLFVTHDQVEAMTLAQRMIVMNAGRMEQIGTPEEVYTRPATTFVASFIGAPPMNLLEGTADGNRFMAGGVSLPLPRSAPRAGPLLLGVRPEHTAFTPVGETPRGARDAEWNLQVDVVEMLGAERLVYCRLGEQFFILRIEGTVRPPQPGERIAVHPDPDRLHWFDPQTRQRVA